jgi:hypothetical protein
VTKTNREHTSPLSSINQSIEQKSLRKEKDRNSECLKCKQQQLNQSNNSNEDSFKNT